MKLFVFIYYLGEDIDKTRTYLGKHISYWKNQTFDYYRNGPFSDKSGGLIIFSSENEEMAQRIVSGDPLLTGKVISNYSLKEWVA